MARGKQAAEAARRRYDTALEHIDRLTEQLAIEKQKRRDAEARAAKLEGLDLMGRNTELRNDRLLAETLDALAAWKRSAARVSERCKKAREEIFERLVPDLKLDLTPVDTIDFLERRYPAIVDFLTGGHGKGPNARIESKGRLAFERRLSTEELHRFQRYIGERGTPEWNPDADIAQVYTDVLEAAAAGFDGEEALDYAGVNSRRAEGEENGR